MIYLMVAVLVGNVVCYAACLAVGRYRLAALNGLNCLMLVASIFSQVVK